MSQVLDLLLHMIENQKRMVRKDDLFGLTCNHPFYNEYDESSLPN